DPMQAAKSLQSMYGESKTGAPYIEGLQDRNAIVVKGTADQIAEVKESLQAILGETGSLTKNAKFRTITLESGNAMLLADELIRIFKTMRKNPIEVISPEKLKRPDVPKKKKKEEGEKLPKPETEARKQAGPGLRRISYQDDGLVDPREKKGGKDLRPGD